MKKVGVALLGLGVVGGGVYDILKNKKEYFRKTQGLDISVECVLVRNAEKAIKRGVEKDKLASSIEDVISNPAVDIVVEAIGGIEPAKTYLLKSLMSGKTVVTANKELFAKHWSELEEMAKSMNAGLFFEASCVGGVPIIRTLQDGMQANEILSIKGIINGTTNYILTKMSAEGSSYEDALKAAQKLGYAESDPTADVEGFDAAYKLSILASLAFKSGVAVENVKREGITSVDKADIAYGKGMGYTLKLLGIGKKTADGIDVRVHPTFIKNEDPLASVSDAFNAVLITGDSVGEIMLYGRGAGDLPTGSAIVSDIIYAAHQRKPHYLPFKNDGSSRDSDFITDFKSKYYVRICATDREGILGRISTVFGKNKIGIEKVFQNEENVNSKTDIIFVTHLSHEKIIEKALKEITALDGVKNVAALIRVEE